ETARENGWHILDYHGLLSGLAFRRKRGIGLDPLPTGLAAALAANPSTAHFVDANGRATLDTRYFGQVGDGTNVGWKGGIFSLDGVHPTTV
ncbi:hypothetical protein ABTN33_19660, partial [Acinetobacter baumannii]